MSEQLDQELPVASYRTLLQVPSLPNLLLCSISSRTGQRIYSVLLVLFVLEIYHSATLSGLIVLVSQLPAIICSPIAGALIDRKGRVALMGTDYLLASCTIAAIMLLSVFHLLPIWLLFVIVGFGSVTQPLSTSGSRVLFPVIVPRHLWDRANGLDSSTYVIATVVGPASAGLAYALFGPHWALIAPIVLYIVAACSLRGVHAPPTNPPTASLFADAVAAVRYVWSNRVLRMLSAILTVFNSGTGSAAVIVPILVLRHLHGGSTTVGLMLAALGVGGFVSAISFGARNSEGKERWLMVSASIVCSSALVFLAFFGNIEIVAFAALIVIGASQGPMSVTMFSLRQRATDPAWFGRAFTVSMNINSAGAALAAGAVGAIIGRDYALAVLLVAVMVFTSGIWPLLFPFAKIVTPHMAEDSGRALRGPAILDLDEHAVGQGRNS